MAKKTLDDVLFYGLAANMDEYQRAFMDAMLTKQAVFVNAPAGTGKTTLAVAAAKYLMESGKVSGLIYTFAPVEEGAMGFRPGSQAEKEAEYLFPLRDALAEIGDNPDKALDEKFGWVKARSHTFMRGTNIERKFLLIDEAQNMTVAQLRKVYTRCHDDTVVVTIGHAGQVDIKRSQSGFERYIEHFRDEPYVAVCSLERNYRGQFANHADQLREGVA